MNDTTHFGLLAAVILQIKRSPSRLAYRKESINGYIYLANCSNLISTQYSCSVIPYISWTIKSIESRYAGKNNDSIKVIVVIVSIHFNKHKLTE